jgi:hypothetical protein
LTHSLDHVDKSEKHEQALDLAFVLRSVMDRRDGMLIRAMPAGGLRWRFG